MKSIRDRVELLLPAGDKDSLRAAVANGADAVYLGLDSFNARSFADNFRREALPSLVAFCHNNNVRTHVTANILVKNSELEDFFNLVGWIGQAGADAIIIQDPCLMPFVRECAPDCEVHISTQATTTNIRAIPEGADRVIVPRELGLEQISAMARKVPIEMFVHGALCLSYSGQCLFSSIAGARSGNRGKCAQPCRHRYNDSYPLSTKDLCMLEKLPEVIRTGVAALKVEGRMRGALYTGAVARIYRKYIDRHYAGEFKVEPRDIEELKMAFNREFTTGFAFNRSVVDPSFSMNRGVYLGTIEKGRLRLEADLRTGDGVMALRGGAKSGNIINRILKDGARVETAGRGDTVEIDVKGARNGDRIFKTFSADFGVDLGADFGLEKTALSVKRFATPVFKDNAAPGEPALFVKVRDAVAAGEANRAGASVIYYDVFGKDCEGVRKNIKEARLFLAAPSVMSDPDIERALDIIEKVRPDGVMAGERGLLSALGQSKAPADVHLDHSFNVFNDIDLEAYRGIPIISPELAFGEVAALRSKRFIVMAHGPLVLMTTKEPLKDAALRDESGRVFRTRRSGDLTEVLNCSELGLFSKTLDYVNAGVKWFCLEPSRDVGRTVGIYRKIISGQPFDDRKLRKGYTTGHFGRGVG